MQILFAALRLCGNPFVAKINSMRCPYWLLIALLLLSNHTLSAQTPPASKTEVILLGTGTLKLATNWVVSGGIRYDLIADPLERHAERFEHL